MDLKKMNLAQLTQRAEDLLQEENLITQQRQEVSDAIWALMNQPTMTWGERFPIHTRARTHRGIQYPAKPTGAFAEIGRRGDGRRAIRLTGMVHNRPVDRVFVEGETAVHGSFNLIYTGTITKVTDKGVTIVDQYGGRAKRLNLDEFSWRNYDYDAQRVADHNANERMYI